MADAAGAAHAGSGRAASLNWYAVAAASASPAAPRAAPAPPQQADAACVTAAADSSAAVLTKEQAEALVGRRVARTFHSGVFAGAVTRARPTRAHGWLWRVKYSDGDSEDLEHGELQQALADAAAHPDAEAEARGAVSSRGLPSASAEERRGADAHAAEAGAAAQQPEPAATLALQHSFKGVHYANSTKAGPSFSAQFCHGGIRSLGVFSTAEAAARAIDSAARAAGRKRMNFPRAGTDEVQASRGDGMQEQSVQLGAAAAASTNFEGVDRTDSGLFFAKLHVRGRRFSGGMHPDAAAAARAYDALVRKHGGTVVNFPRPGSGEVQAVKGQLQPQGLGMASQPPQTAGKRSRADDAATPEAAGAAAPAAKRARAAADARAALAAAASAHAAVSDATAGDATATAAVSPACATMAADADAGAAADAAAASHSLKMPFAEPPADAADVAAFLRGIRPPLTSLDATLAALPRSGIGMAHLAAVTRAGPSLQKLMIKEAAKQLRITAGGDRIAFMAALQALAPPPQAAE